MDISLSLHGLMKYSKGPQMFNNKNLQLASYGHLDFYYFQSFLHAFENTSLVNLSGDLLFSKDTAHEPTTTSRLVVYQIVKRYLNLNPGDIFITNDPENGGYTFQKIFFISCLTPNLFLIWNENFNLVNFKIPLSPLLESHKKNSMLWSALIDNQTDSEKFNLFFNSQINHYNSCFNATPFLDFLSEPDFQQIWFTTCKSEYDRQYDLRATGQTDLSLKYFNKLIKSNLIIDERQNQKSITLDFSHTQLAEEQSAASHVIESTLIQEIVKFYNLGVFLSQPILNQIKLIMPPKSLISKAHSKGQYNFEFQSLFKQIIEHLFKKLNNSKKLDPKFILKSEAQINLMEINIQGLLLDDHLKIGDVYQKLTVLKQQMKDNLFICEYKKINDEPMSLNLNYLNTENSMSFRSIKINSQNINSGLYKLNKNDVLSIEWKI